MTMRMMLPTWWTTTMLFFCQKNLPIIAEFNRWFPTISVSKLYFYWIVKDKSLFEIHGFLLKPNLMQKSSQNWFQWNRSEAKRKIFCQDTKILKCKLSKIRFLPQIGLQSEPVFWNRLKCIARIIQPIILDDFNAASIVFKNFVLFLFSSSSLLISQNLNSFIILLSKSCWILMGLNFTRHL